MSTEARSTGRPSGEAQGAAGEALREWRAARGLTLQEVADKTGISKSYLSAIELGKSSPTVRTLEEIAKALGADLNLFLTKPRRRA